MVTCDALLHKKQAGYWHGLVASSGDRSTLEEDSGDRCSLNWIALARDNA
ncbi:MAG: hypothetical protein AAGG55_05195 [Pseudomonadota bacterium]